MPHTVPKPSSGSSSEREAVPPDPALGPSKVCATISSVVARSVDCVRALGLLWSQLGVRISMRMAAHWLQIYLSCLVRNPNLTLHSWFIVKGVSVSISLALSYVWLEKPLVLV